jgi:hypothetical protein
MTRSRSRFLLGLLAGAACAVAGLAALQGSREVPWSDEERVMAARMHAFSRALTNPPGNPDPAPEWRPLLRDADPEEVLCSVCHGDSGIAMERAIANGALRIEESPAAEKPEMVELMERWVHQLNRHARDRLVKAVRCVDCHASDPRD